METIELPVISARRLDSHKGDFGKVLVIAGSEAMIGAPALVAMGAFRAGSGLVRIATSKDVLGQVISICPMATGYALSGTKVKELLEFADQHDVLAVGPGLGVTPVTKRIVLELIERHQGPMVFDADALNILAALDASEWPKRKNWGNIILTPHMGEYMRLIGAVMKRGANVSLGTAEVGSGKTADADEKAPEPKKVRSLVADDDDTPSTADGVTLDLPAEPETTTALTGVDAPKSEEPKKEADPAAPDRTPLAELLSRGTGAIVVLKGHRTVVTDGHRAYVNSTGNPAMATAGSGDVLCGVIASLIGQRISPLDAAVLGVHIHGAAGDLAQEAICGQGAKCGGITALDIAAYVPRALAERVG
jgi:NAD(P)H-hydrate repair Nnr-like enzyme with NAD(P)H-hydrate dehydratase domain